MPTVDTQAVGFFLKRVYKKGQHALGELTSHLGGPGAREALNVGHRLASGNPLTKKRARRFKRYGRIRGPK